MHNVVIIGSGCAGNTAAIYTARANLKPLVIKGHEAGGQLSLTTEVENFPGFPEGINGPELVENMKQQAERFGAVYRDGQVAEADLSQRPFRLNIEGEVDRDPHSHRRLRRQSPLARSALRAAADRPRRQLLRHLRRILLSRKKIMVVGGGDSAMEEANFLTRFGREVALVHRRDSFRASKIMLDRARANPKIEFVMNTAVEEVFDVKQNIVTGVRLRNIVTGDTWERDVDGLFVAIGHIPNTQLFRGQLDLDPDGYIVSHGGARTNIHGVFHAGDVQDRVYRQAITASGAGCMAAIEAERLLEAEGH